MRRVAWADQVLTETLIIIKAEESDVNIHDDT